MLNDLIKLANYYDRNDMPNEANVIDTYIVRAQSMGDSRGGPTVHRPDAYDETEVYQDAVANEFRDIPEISDKMVLDIGNNPIGKMIEEYVKNALLVSDEGSSTGRISVSDIRDVVDYALKYNSDTLETYTDMKSNPSPISPVSFKKVILSIALKLYKSSTAMGDYDVDTLMDLIDMLYKNYEEAYTEEYMGIESGDYQFINNEPSVQNPDLKLPTEEEMLGAHDLQDRHESRMKQEQWYDDLARENSPELHERRRKEHEDKMRSQYPEEWHDTLFPN